MVLKGLGAVFFDPMPVFGTPECQVAVGQTMLFRDGHHLTDENSLRLDQAVVGPGPFASSGQVSGAGN